MDIRAVQLEADACWCDNPSFVTGGGADIVLHTECVGESRLWCFVTSFNLSLKEADHFVSEVGLALPPDSLYYGSREEHVTQEYAGHQELHSCVALLVAFARPTDVSSFASAFTSFFSKRFPTCFFVEVSPPHCTLLGPEFLSVVEWVQRHIEFIDAVDRFPSFEGLRRWTFGYSSILAALGKQFGSAVEFLLEEIILAKKMSDKEDDVLSSAGWIPYSYGVEGVSLTVYAERVTPL
jgi:hypothetical protein